MSLKVTILICIFCLCNSAVNDFPPSIKVYAESLCPDTINFIVTSFGGFREFPDRSKLLKSIDFIVFGNASEDPGSKEGSRKFKCQHGEKECLGNKILNCSHKYLPNDLYEKFLICFSRSIQIIGRDKAILFDITEQCSEASKEIIECSVSSEGEDLLHEAGLNTGPHNYVPYIIVNDTYSDDFQKRAENNILKFLCDYSREVGHTRIPSCDFIEFPRVKNIR
jgi:interferon gamma-inducible protein 30